MSRRSQKMSPSSVSSTATELYEQDDELLSACLTLLDVLTPFQQLMAPEVAGAVAKLEELVYERVRESEVE